LAVYNCCLYLHPCRKGPNTQPRVHAEAGHRVPTPKLTQSSIATNGFLLPRPELVHSEMAASVCFNLAGVVMLLSTFHLLSSVVVVSASQIPFIWDDPMKVPGDNTLTVNF
jgi:hypothetical protein